MGRILAIDYGRKRTGMAVTDPLKIIASPLETIPTHTLVTYLKEYFLKEEVETIVLGLPLNTDNLDTDVTQEIRHLHQRLKKEFVGKDIHLHDEKFTSKMAMDAMITGGMKKKERRKKENIDKISATIILQSYLEST